MAGQVIVTIDGETGDVKVEAQGVVGRGCEALTKQIEDALGTVTADQKKPEYHQTAAAGQQQKAQQR